jgi:hypothetical protein
MEVNPSLFLLYPQACNKLSDCCTATAGMQEQTLGARTLDARAPEIGDDLQACP